MSLSTALLQRANNQCELCASALDLQAFEVSGSDSTGDEVNIVVCDRCHGQLKAGEELDINHWRCLNESMWSTVPAVQVVVYRLLFKLSKEGWPQDLLDMLYLEEGVLTWAKNQADAPSEDDDKTIHRDSNGVELLAGDSIVIIKDLKVKGTSFVAKRGTAVRNISLVHDNPELIEGKVNGQQIVILTQYVKK